MPPKKAVEEPKVGAWMLGRFSKNLKVGLVGLPNVGKSTLYNCLSKSSHAKTLNVPFCTIDPNETRVFVEDPRFQWLCEKYKPKSEVQAFLTVVDIAGLVKGAAQGEGLGNAFLSHISGVDGLIHVMRAFEDDDIIHAEDTVDPVRDINTIMEELRVKDKSFMESRRAQHKKGETGAKAKGGQFKKRFDEEMETMDKIIEWLDSGKDVKNGMDVWTTKDIEFLNDYGLITAKPCMFAVNLNKKDFARKKNKFLKPIFEWVQANSPGSAIIPFCAGYEEELKDMAPEKALEQLKADELQSAMPRMISTGFHMVHLIYFFTAGSDEVKAWTIRKGSKAPQAAGAIHSDFERGFICAEIMGYDDLYSLGSEAEVKAAGKFRQEGKTYEVRDGDVINFKFNVTTNPKK